MGDAGKGVVVYLDHEQKTAAELVDYYVRRGETRPYRPERTNANEPRESLKVLGVGAQILSEVGVGEMRLLTNRPKKLFGLDGYGLEIVEQSPIPDDPSGGLE
ncbi:MAG: bifunctional 3,4-dihydroxy-2-butanone-4-phosphate synthase/GTP cyclohydrolase II, partial [Bradymonadaceae bacterium]